jgi:hypothetical protein
MSHYVFVFSAPGIEFVITCMNFGYEMSAFHGAFSLNKGF